MLFFDLIGAFFTMIIEGLRGRERGSTQMPRNRRASAEHPVARVD